MTDEQYDKIKLRHITYGRGSKRTGVICAKGSDDAFILVALPEKIGMPSEAQFLKSNPWLVLDYISPVDEYQWVNYKESHIVIGDLISVSTPSISSDEAEKYISKNFPNIDDDTKDIYLNIFLEGTKYIKQ